MGFIIPAALSLASVLLGAKSQAKQEDFMRAQKAAADRQARKQALAQAIGATGETGVPQLPPKGPAPPSTMGLDVARGLTSLGATMTAPGGIETPSGQDMVNAIRRRIQDAAAGNTLAQAGMGA